eukprot:1667030-Rhodomonas_salina.1
MVWGQERQRKVRVGIHKDAGWHPKGRRVGIQQKVGLVFRKVPGRGRPGRDRGSCPGTCGPRQPRRVAAESACVPR